ncbi:MAG: hypothetical protein ABWY55_04055 [Microbacterium sp.]
MRTRLAVGAAALALLLALAGCTSSTGSDGGAADDTAPTAPSESADDSGDSSGEAFLATASTSLGDVVVDSAGMTLYMFDNDEQGTTTSACTGQCLDNWPPLIATDDGIEVDGVSGDVATIDTPDGEKQVTLNGWPLYYFAGDSAPGDVAGQGVGGIWWVLTPAGERFAG